MRVVTIPLALVLLIATPICAFAHELQVLEQGGARIDAGLAEPARLVHAVLVDERDRLEVTVSPGMTPIEAVLLVPDRSPETDEGMRHVASLEATRGRTPGLRSIVASVDDLGARVVDEATGIAYREVSRLEAVPGTGPSTFVVRRGAAPGRVALRVGLPTAFAASDVKRTPRAAVDARLWAETPPPGSVTTTARARRSEPDRRYAWYGAGIAVLGLVTVVWWVQRGRAASRRRGLERAREE